MRTHRYAYTIYSVHVAQELMEITWPESTRSQFPLLFTCTRLFIHGKNRKAASCVRNYQSNWSSVIFRGGGELIIFWGVRAFIFLHLAHVCLPVSVWLFNDFVSQWDDLNLSVGMSIWVCLSEPLWIRVSLFECLSSFLYVSLHVIRARRHQRFESKLMSIEHLFSKKSWSVVTLICTGVTLNDDKVGSVHGVTAGHQKS